MTTRRGANAIEFALVLPLLMIFVMAVLDWGLYFQMRRGAVDAVRDGVRAGAAHHDRAEIETVTRDRIHLLLEGQGLCAPPDCVVGTTISGPQGRQLLTASVVLPYDAPVGFVATPANFTVEYTMFLEMQ